VRTSFTPRSPNNDREAGLGEAPSPVVLAGDEHRDAVDERTAGLEDLLDVPLGGQLGADRQVGDDHVGLCLAEDLDDVGRLAGRLGDLLLEVLAQPVVGHAAVHGHVEVRNVGELDRVVLTGPDRLGEVLVDFVGVDVEGGRELDVADVVATQVDVHEARDRLGGVGVAVVLDALDERGGAVAHADDGDADLLGRVAGGAVGGVLDGHWKMVPSWSRPWRRPGAGRVSGGVGEPSGSPVYRTFTRRPPRAASS
jgi:hypothetical protein